MSRILAIDYGTKRTGLAVTDPGQLIATGLATIPTNQLETYLDQYFQKEAVELIVIGEPKQMNNTASESQKKISIFTERFKKQHPEIPVVQYDERFTSRMAFQTMIDSGLKKKDRQNKSLVDVISATIILQGFLENRPHRKENR